MKYALVPLETERVGSAVIGAAIEVHRHLGPGFLERIYKEALCLELEQQRLAFEREKSVEVNYTLHEVHEAKVISYLKTTSLRLGYLLNFHHTTMKEGIKRIVL